jgi:hypothetical protein
VLIDESEVRDEDAQEAPELSDRVGERHMLAQRGVAYCLHYTFPLHTHAKYWYWY